MSRSRALHSSHPARSSCGCDTIVFLMAETGALTEIPCRTPGSAILLRSKIGRLRRYQVSLDEPEFQISVAVYSSRVRQVQEACEEYARWLGNRQPCTQPSFEQEIWLGERGVFDVEVSKSSGVALTSPVNFQLVSAS